MSAQVEPAGTGGLVDDVLAELRRRPVARVALVVLVVLHALAVYAPLLASDRPYVLEAVDRGAYERARRGLTAVAASLAALAEEGARAYTEARPVTPAVPAYADAVALEERALGLRLATMRAYLPAERHAPLDALAAAAANAAARARTDRPDAAATREAAVRLRDAARTARAALAVRDAATSEGEGVELVGRRSFPLLASLGAADAFAMVTGAFVLGWALWRRVALRVGLRARSTRVAVALALASLAALAWARLGPDDPGAAFDVAGYKEGLGEGAIVATRVLFPPLPYGYAETHVDEAFRPPTWTAASQIDDRGAYVRGARVPVPDPVTGALPVTTPVDVRFAEASRNAALRHPLGTDESGRDLLARMLWGGRVSLAVGLVSAALVAVVGLAVGVLAGYAGGRTDLLLSRAIEVVQCVPAFFLVLAAVAVVPPQLVHPLVAIVVVIALVRWTGVARLVRAECLRLREQEFVLAARTLGFSPWRVAVHHVLPNALGPVLVALVFSVAAGILTESAVSFLGFGVREPVPSWGALLSESRALEHWWIQVFPGLAIFVTVLAYNLVGEAVRDALDPRSAPARVEALAR